APRRCLWSMSSIAPGRFTRSTATASITPTWKRTCRSCSRRNSRGGPDVGAWLDYWPALQKILVLSLGGAAGTNARYWLGLWVGAQPWARGLPFGTMIINVSGSFILGVASVLFLERLPLEYRTWYLLIGTGFCGGYTTFS